MKKQTIYKTEAIVLKSYDVKEYDRLYVIFSKEHGLMRVVGVGTRKPKAKLASGLEPLTRSELFLVCCRGLDKVTGVIIHNQFKNIRGNLESIASVKRIFLLVEALAPEMESAQEVYELLCYFLEYQNGQDEQDQAVLNQKQRLVQMAVIWKIVQWAGYEPHLFHCWRCNSRLEEKSDYEFLVPDGVICERCSGGRAGARGLRLNKDVVKLLRLFSQKRLEIISKIKISKEIFLQTQRVTNVMVACVTRKGNIL